MKEVKENLAKNSASLVRLSAILGSSERNMKMLFLRVDSAFGFCSIIETHYGNIVMDDSGNVRLDNGVWDRSFSALFIYLFI